ncbi:uncharacterized protein TNCV_2342571 [Trichonephila clavipes]|nr:uncharacterized protein TNCV_2342571 [Trichonephila clavipes]
MHLYELINCQLLILGIQQLEGRFVLGTFHSEQRRVHYRSRQNDRLRVMLVLVRIDITPPHTPLLVFRRIGERKIHNSWRACKQLRRVIRA